MPTDLLESNLFGHVKRRLHRRHRQQEGLFEVADGGSIFFDEIGTISLETQAKLLRVIQEKEFMRVGGVETQKVDVRIIAATNVDLEEDGAPRAAFRDDLYYRLVRHHDRDPAAARAREDIPLLAEHFMRPVRRPRTAKPIGGVDPDALPGAASTTTGRATCARARERASSAPSCFCSSGGRIGLGLLPGDRCCPARARGELPIRLPENGATYKQTGGGGRAAPDPHGTCGGPGGASEAGGGAAERIKPHDAARDHQAAGRSASNGRKASASRR